MRLTFSLLTLAALIALLGILMMEAPVKVIDGDSIRTRGFGTIRIEGIDAPEINGRCPEEKALAKAAKRRLEELLSLGKPELTWRRVKEKYGRGLAKVKINGSDVGTILIEEGFARPYAGGKRAPWCNGG